MVTPYLVFLGLIGLQRFSELVVSNRHAQWAAARGGIEYGRGQLLPMKLLHTGFLCSCALEVVWLDRPFDPSLGLSMLVLAVLAQGVRYWSMHALGPYWNTRILVIPGAGAVDSGPYRYVRHPNYLAVVIEGVAIPLVHGAWVTAVVFSLLNTLLLARRIACEESALVRETDYGARFAGKGRFLPCRSA